MKRLVIAFKLSTILAIACCVNALPTGADAQQRFTPISAAATPSKNNNIICPASEKLCGPQDVQQNQWCCAATDSCGSVANSCVAPPGPPSTPGCFEHQKKCWADEPNFTRYTCCNIDQVCGTATATDGTTVAVCKDPPKKPGCFYEEDDFVEFYLQLSASCYRAGLCSSNPCSLVEWPKCMDYYFDNYGGRIC